MPLTKTGTTLPEIGKPHEEILARLQEMRHSDVKWKEGRVWSLVYYVDEEHLDLINKAYKLYLSENMLNPYAWDSLRHMEKEIKSMAIDLLNGDNETVGVITSGGTESIFQAVYTYREWARQKKRQVRQPEMVVPVSIHPAFEKAAYILGIKIKKLPVGDDLRAQPELIRKAITSNTIMLAASAPSYPNGVLDPIQEISEIAMEHGLPFHVDACVGGYMLPWVERLGKSIPAWDFRVKGVTSMSADLHKFGYAAKGCSTLLYRSMDYMKHQFFIATDFPGGIYASATFQGSRSGGPIAAAWAAMNALGQDGYLRIAEKIMDATEQLKERIGAIPELRVLADPVMNIISFSTTSSKLDIYVIADFMEEKGWMVDRQQFPNSVHLTVMHHHIPAIDQYIQDLKEAVQYAKDHPKATAKGNAALYGLMSRIPFRGMVKNNVRKLFEEMYSNPAGKYKSTDEEEGEVASANPSDSSPAWAGPLNRILFAFGRFFGKK
jgi:glutamate/tyrosine decarboxylase-like PLP-dependent enzyme